MECNSRGSPGRTLTSNQPPTRSRKNSSDNADLQYRITKIDTQSEDDSIMHEKIGQAAGHRSGIQKEEAEEAMTHDSALASTTQTRRAVPLSIGRAVSNNHLSMRVPLCMTRHGSKSSRLIKLLQDTTIQPPVTITTLQELDLYSVQNNINLRVDICYDPELYFQPISGQKGDEKRNEAKKYWSALAAEFQIYTHDAQQACLECQQLQSESSAIFEPRLPAFFDNLREIIQMLVPDSDHEEVANHLDTDLLMQQVCVGAMDAVRLSTWLASLLTSHCAPMRDCTAAAVTEEIRRGTEEADMEILVQGLQKLFGLLEAMKLDVANHQIRSFRYLLIEGTVEFQRDYFLTAIETQQIDIEKSQRWYRMECFGHRMECGFQENSEPAQQFASFVHGLVHLCNPYEKKLPLTLQYDHNRIMRLQEDLQDHIQTNLCLAVFNQQVREIAGSHCDPSLMHNDLKQRIICLTEDDDGNGGAISDHLEAIGTEITRAAFAMRSPSRDILLSLTSFDLNRTIKLLYDVFRNEDAHRSVTMSFLASLEERTMQHAEQFHAMTTLGISNAQKHWAQARSGTEVLLAEWDEMARQLAHIGVIHWRVWRDLCYCDPQDCNNKTDELDLSPNSGELHYARDRIGEHSGWRLSSVPPSSLLDHSDCDADSDLDPGMVCEQGVAAIQILDSLVQRQDSGFAELAEDFTLEGNSSGRISDIDLEQESAREKPSGNSLGRLR